MIGYGKFVHLGEVSDNEIESVLLHIRSLAPVCCLQDLEDVLHRDVPLQVGLAEDLEPVVGEDVEMRSREEVETVFWGHHHISIINVAQKRVKALS